MKTDHLLVGIDAGNTIIKAGVYDSIGTEIAVARRRTPQTRPGPGLAEQDPEATWDVAATVVRDVLSHPDIDAPRVVGVCVSGYGNGLWLVDEEGWPVRPAISSADTRATEIVDRARLSNVAEEIRGLVWHNVWAGQPGPLLVHLSENEPEVLARATSLLFCKDYLRYRLTGQLATDRTDLSCGGLALGTTGEPARDVLELLGVSHLQTLLDTPLLDSLSICGPVSADAAASTGLPAGLPVAAGVVDILAAALGSGVVEDAEVAVTSGTWGINAQLSSNPCTDGSILASVLTFDPERHLLVEAGATSAGNLEWFVESFLDHLDERSDRYAVCNKEVASVSATDSQVFFVPHITGAIENGNARAGFYGLSREHTRAHAVRAIYQGVANEHRLQLERLGVDLAATEHIRFSGGAASSEVWSQIFADTLGTRLEVPAATELGALGAAMIAGIAIGTFDGYLDAANTMVRIRRRYSPDPAATGPALQYYNRYLRIREAFLAVAGAP